jgi:hypothetical protein
VAKESIKLTLVAKEKPARNAVNATSVGIPHVIYSQKMIAYHRNTINIASILRYLTNDLNVPPFIKHFVSVLSPNKEKSPLGIICQFSQSFMVTGLKVEIPRYNKKAIGGEI